MINNILDSGKLESGTLDVDPQPANIYQVVGKIQTIFSQIMESRNLHGLFKIRKNVPSTLKFDETRITQVLMNLLSNAIKFTRKGSIQVVVEWI